ncbi:hypothetical protein Glove_682g42 [Diversispora epigaea]|uniref:MYND-type domain-containing protein n=1 Tax=Diversispora epigaea TaxID=1348612 RepID=A0A397GAX8_9GLOM|nr:hypothetical protein Glove_682g42 [Diversispora epigaea]
MDCTVCKKSTNKRCSRCSVKYYCSPSCQKKDYPNHKLDCPLRSAEILVKNAFADKMPTNVAVLYEYGFSNCMGNPRDTTMLFGLYIGLIKHIGCSASQIHSWWEKGELALNIKKAYDDAGATSGYYSWFLKNEHFLQGLHKYEGEKTDKGLADRYFEKVKPYLSEHDQTVPTESLPESKREVIAFYKVMLTGCMPRIEFPMWIDFGFCTCKVGNDYLGESEEKKLSELYQELIIQKGCKIDEFHEAYLSGSIVDLLKKKCNDCSWLIENRIEVRGFNQPTKSVYYLKQCVLSESVSLESSVIVDYGFMNCRTEDEIKQLRNMYKKLFKTPRFDLQDLHKACMAGKIFNYIRSILPSEVVNANLLKNPYPLHDY